MTTCGLRYSVRPTIKSKTYLADDFEFAVQPFFVLFEYLDVVVCKSQRAQPDGGDQHQYHIDIVQLAQQQTGDQDCNDNDDTAPCWALLPC